MAADGAGEADTSEYRADTGIELIPVIRPVIAPVLGGIVDRCFPARAEDIAVAVENAVKAAVRALTITGLEFQCEAVAVRTGTEISEAVQEQVGTLTFIFIIDGAVAEHFRRAGNVNVFPVINILLKYVKFPQFRLKLWYT